MGEAVLASWRAKKNRWASSDSVYGAAGAQPEACRAFYRQGADRLIGDLAAYLRRANAAGALKVRHPRQAADLFFAMFLGDGHIRGLLMLDMPGAREKADASCCARR